MLLPTSFGFSGGSVVKNPLVNAGDVGSVPGSGRSSEVGNGCSLQFSSLEKPYGQRSLEGPLGHKRKEYDLVTK